MVESGLLNRDQTLNEDSVKEKGQELCGSYALSLVGLRQLSKLKFAIGFQPRNLPILAHSHHLQGSSFLPTLRLTLFIFLSQYLFLIVSFKVQYISKSKVKIKILTEIGENNYSGISPTVMEMSCIFCHQLVPNSQRQSPSLNSRNCGQNN